MNQLNIDHDLEVLEKATKAVFLIDKKYKKASFDEKLEIKDARDKAFNAYMLARIQLVRDGIICTPDDVDQMKNIRQEVEQAANTQSLIIAIFRLARFLTKLLNI